MWVWERIRSALAGAMLCLVASPVWALCPDLVVLGHIAHHAEALSNSRSMAARQYHGRVLSLDLSYVDAPRVASMLADEYSFGREDWVQHTLDRLASIATAGANDNADAIQSLMDETDVYIGLNRFRIAGGMPNCPALSEDVPIAADEDEEDSDGEAPNLELGSSLQNSPTPRPQPRSSLGQPILIGAALALVLALIVVGKILWTRLKQRREPRILCDTDCEVRMTSKDDASSGAQHSDMEFTRVLNINRFGMCISQPHTPIRGGHIDIRCRGDVFGGTVRWSNDRCFGVQLDTALSEAEVTKITDDTTGDAPQPSLA
ncbi:hypothetical protein V8J82_01125 [Gymnodinialimonas sp. 2305UL16-5]|uniref:hypothetical protein n=1 Tax=Gymnodinialimonas mytili TaxID=3126503 RepID=UPI0030A0C2EB